MNSVVSAQHSLGNRALQQLLRRQRVQGQTHSLPHHDPLEQETDSVAHEVLRISDLAQSQVEVAATSHAPRIHRQCTGCEEELQRRSPLEEEEPLVQGKHEGTSAIEPYISSLPGRGEPLAPPTRAFMDPRFGVDLSAVRIHTDAEAHRSAESLQALAYTVGSDIVFRAGQFDPDSQQGRRLLAHELTHVVQQGGADASPTDSDTIQRQLVTPPGPEGNPGSDGPGQAARGAEATTRPTENAAGAPECTPAAGIPNTNCGAYLANAWWLPFAYVNNATCACQETPNEPTADCVRKFLQDRMAATPGWVKVAAASQKPNDIPGGPTYPAYQAFVQAFLTPRIYADHVDAYANCCCPSGPARYPAWVGVTSVPLPCPAVGWSIRQFGPCHGTPGAW